MKYKGIEFEAIMATPGVGKSFLCDNNPQFVDGDEVRMRCRFCVPDDITREEREKFKGISKPYEKKSGDVIQTMYAIFDKHRAEGRTLVLSPHAEFYNYLETRHIPFCYIYQGEDTKEELRRRFRQRGNSEEIVKRFAGDEEFDAFRKLNLNESRANVKYEFSKNEYLTDIIKLFE